MGALAASVRAWTLRNIAVPSATRLIGHGGMI